VTATASRNRPPRPLQPHGTTARAHGRPRTGVPPCDCKPCVEAVRRYRSRQKNLRNLGRSGFVPAAATVQYMNLLIEAGMTWDELLEATGFGGGTIIKLRGPGAEDRMIRTSTQTRLLAVPMPERGRPAGAWVVDGTGTRRRRRALARIGWSSPALAPHSEFGHKFLRDLQHCGNVAVSTRARMAALFELVKDEPGPSTWTARHAEREGWLPPSAWDGFDIDDPATDPTESIERSRLEVVAEEAEFLESQGLSQHAIASQLGLTVNSLQIYLARSRRHASDTESELCEAAA